MNKKDLLEEKIMTSHISDYFDDFDGEMSVIIICILIRKLYRSQARSHSSQRLHFEEISKGESRSRQDMLLAFHNRYW